mmetsp:Transcript_96004/g.151195  ORF Transcript_96004/g.151195 Transcript_96004/m.151195 type:complete len:319 (+) Transcript_96004:80-1036(+)
MVELKLEPLSLGNARDTYVSVRIGEVQKLARATQSRVYKFPASVVGNKKFGKLDIFKRVGGSNVALQPTSDVDQELNMDLEDKSNVKFKVSLQGLGDKASMVPVQSPPVTQKDDNPKLNAAKAYLEQHNLEMRLSEAMQGVLRDRPDDPASYIGAMLAKSAGTLTYKPKGESQSAPKSAPATASMAVPVATYSTTHFKQCPASAFQTIYSMFPTKATTPAKPVVEHEEEKVKARARGALTSALLGSQSKGNEDSLSLQEQNAKASAREAISAALLGSTSPQGPQGSASIPDQTNRRGFAGKPSVGTWCGHRRHPPGRA